MTQAHGSQGTRAAAWRIARRELLEMRRDGRLWVAGVLMLVLLGTALAVGWRHQQAFEAERVAAQALDHDDWLRQAPRHPHDAAHQGLHVFKPLPALAIVDPGITPYTGSTLWLQAHRQSELRFRPAQDATGLQRFGQLSVAWVLQVLGPLIVVVLGFGMVASEREQGTLKQTLSLGVSLRQFVAGKALALATATGLLLAPALAALVAAVAVSHWPVDDGARAALLALGYGLYFAVVIVVVLAVSAWATNARMAIATLLGLWIVSVTLLPRAASDLARQLHPSPSRASFTKALDGDLQQAYEQVWRHEFGTARRFGPDLPLARWGQALRVDDHAGYAVMDRHFEALWQSFAAQQRAQELAGLLAPLLPLRSLSMAVAGTDFAVHRDFSVQAERHRRLMQDLISEDLVHHADPRGAGDFDYQADQRLWAKVPAFQYQAPPASSAAARGALALGVLAFDLAVALAFLTWAVARRARNVT